MGRPHQDATRPEKEFHLMDNVSDFAAQSNPAPMTKDQLMKAKAPPPMPPIAFENVPFEMRESNCWLGWYYKWRNNCWSKVPLQWVVRNGKLSPVHGNAADSKTWTDFESIQCHVALHHDMSVLNNIEPFIGPGFVSNQAHNGITLVDFDHCRNRDTGKIQPWALEWIRKLDSYSEVSPSGTGIKVWAKGAKPGARCRRKSKPCEWNHESEWYRDLEFYADDRFGTVTGNRLDIVSNRVEERESVLAELYKCMFPEAETERANNRNETDHPPRDFNPSLSLADDEIIDRALSAANGDRFRDLWNGTASSFGNNGRSEADFSLACALAFWCGPDAHRIESLMLQSGLVRSKWHQKRGNKTYLALTIERAIARQRTFYGDDFSRTPNEFAHLAGMTFQIYKPKGQLPLNVATLVAATMGTPRPFPESMSDFDSRPPGFDKVQAEMDAREADEKTIAAIAAQHTKNRSDTYRCEFPRRPILRPLVTPVPIRRKPFDGYMTEDIFIPPLKPETIIQEVACESSKCRGCWNRKKELMKRVGRLYLTLLETGGLNQPAYIAALEMSDEAFRARVSRMRRVLPADPDSDSPRPGYAQLTTTDGTRYAITTFPGILDDQPGYEETTGRIAADRLDSLIDTLGATGPDNGRVFRTSQNWPIPREEKDSLKKFELVGMLNKNLTQDELHRGVTHLGSTIENVSHRFNCGPDKHTKSAVMIRHNACGGDNWESLLECLLVHGMVPDKEWTPAIRPSNDPTRLTEPWRDDDPDPPRLRLQPGGVFDLMAI